VGKCVAWRKKTKLPCGCQLKSVSPHSHTRCVEKENEVAMRLSIKKCFTSLTYIMRIKLTANEHNRVFVMRPACVALA
jgi:hypothetical protein